MQIVGNGAEILVDEFACPEAGAVVLHDAASGQWLRFARPREIVSARQPAAVPSALARVEAAVARPGVAAAGFVSYEAATGLDTALQVRPEPRFPLLWFGIYDKPAPTTLPELPPPPAWTPDWAASLSPAEYAAALGRIKDFIRRGETYQVNFTYRLRAACATAPWPLFLQLCAAQGPGYSAYVDAGDWVICSASPELFFRLEGDRIESRPMKGTAARGLTPAQDEERAAALLASAKDRAENVMIVDMVRNDIGRIARPGTVHVSDLFRAEKYPTVWQMTSTVCAETDAGLEALFRALFPAASITGAPKARTMAIIADLETQPRRVYTGAIGYVGPGRRAQFNVAIRTVLIDRQQGEAEYGVGGGIVWDSDVRREAAECRTKTRVLEAPLPLFRLLETMLWLPDAGCRLLEPHFERLERSAQYFEFRVDMKRVREALTRALPAAADVPHKVRLLVDRHGAVEIETSPFRPGAADKLPRVGLARDPVAETDPFLYHKTTNRRVYEQARAGRPDCDDVLLYNRHGQVTESTIANVAVEEDGVLYTPPVNCGLLARTQRALLLAQGRLREKPIAVEQLRDARRVVLMNSVRGLYEVSLLD